MGLTDDQAQEIQIATQAAWTQMLDALRAVKGYNWQAFGDQDGVAESVSQGACASVMADYCAPEQFAAPKLLDISDGSAQVIAGFLIARGPYWYLGTGWEGCNIDYYRSPLLDMDVGIPTSNCTQIAPNVFARNFTTGYAELDCNAYTATLNFANMPL